VLDFNPESAVEETSRHEREAILERRRHGTMQVQRIFLLIIPSLLIEKFTPEYRLMKVRLEVAASWIRCGKVASRSLCQVQLLNPGSTINAAVPL
jgi:uncharacterized protein (DUF736 family)